MNGLIIADDLTGALDTAVQFCSEGFSAIVLNKTEDVEDVLFRSSDVVVINAESRHLNAQDARIKVGGLLSQALAKQHFAWYLKKIDSALRGNIGSEIQALFDVLHPAAVDMLPAYPQAGRTTQNGEQMIDGVPVAKTVFHDDPFNPVCISRIADMIREQTNLSTYEVPSLAETPQSSQGAVFIYDAVTEDDLMRRYQRLRALQGRNVYAGCAGIAQIIAQAEKKSSRKRGKQWIQCASPLVLCGSLNAVTKTQLAYAQKEKIERLTLSDGMLDESALSDDVISQLNNGPLMIDTADLTAAPLSAVQAGKRMAAKLGLLCRQIIDAQPDTIVFVIGGDTLTAALHALNDPVLIPLGEPCQGTVAFCAQLPQGDRYFFSKSGGFGSPQCIAGLIRNIQGGLWI